MRKKKKNKRRRRSNADINGRENGEKTTTNNNKKTEREHVIEVRTSQHTDLFWRSDPSPIFSRFFFFFYFYVILSYCFLLDRKQMKILNECEAPQFHELSEARK